jgi:uncharacterized protein (TIGR03083 family)
MDAPLDALRSSIARLRQLVEPLHDADLEAAAYPSEWTVADVLSHIGSGAVILRRHLDDGLTGQPTPDDFAPSVWASWNSKLPRTQADDALEADRALLERLDSLTDEERSRFVFSLGPMSFDIAGFVGLRLNEHAFHTWDIEVAGNAAATIPAEATAAVVDNLELVARFTAKPTGDTRLISIRTADPVRDFAIELTPDGVTLAPASAPDSPDIELPAEALARLVYGRLDPDHTPATKGDTAVIDTLRRIFPGP